MITFTGSGFYDGDTSFGLMKKGIVHTSSDFNFTLLAEVICAVPASSGYLINLTPQREGGITRYSYIIII